MIGTQKISNFGKKWYSPRYQGCPLFDTVDMVCPVYFQLCSQVYLVCHTGYNLGNRIRPVPLIHQVVFFNGLKTNT